jgi:hypothetical protein
MLPVHEHELSSVSQVRRFESRFREQRLAIDPSVDLEHGALGPAFELVLWLLSSRLPICD